MVRLLNLVCPLLVLLGCITKKKWLKETGVALSLINVGLGVGYFLGLLGFCVI